LKGVFSNILNAIIPNFESQFEVGLALLALLLNMFIGCIAISNVVLKQIFIYFSMQGGVRLGGCGQNCRATGV